MRGPEARRDVSPGKHQPTRLSTYLRVHSNYVAGFERDGFVEPGHDLDFQPVPGGLLLEGEARCQGGLVVEVRKLLVPLDDSSDDPEVQTRWYSYNVALQGVGTIFRYDSPVDHDSAGHHRHHHVHRYDVLAGDREGRIKELRHPDDVPTLGEVFEEARGWYYAHVDQLPSP